ncbi:hypothetical protein C0J52_07122 [Blattella germanica]|nr:hypothetical protein C0J52_07122 [Blattella germanica]
MTWYRQRFSPTQKQCILKLGTLSLWEIGMHKLDSDSVKVAIIIIMGTNAHRKQGVQGHSHPFKQDAKWVTFDHSFDATGKYG